MGIPFTVRSTRHVKLETDSCDHQLAFDLRLRALKEKLSYPCTCVWAFREGYRFLVSELLRSAETACEAEEERVDSTLAAKEKRLTEILQKADDLRLRTLKGVLEILTPVQAVHFLIAAAELHSRLHDWGKKKDDRAHRNHH
ncbi:hypothetical protein Peur_049727 [Populus x canadensis]